LRAHEVIQININYEKLSKNSLIKAASYDTKLSDFIPDEGCI